MVWGAVAGLAVSAAGTFMQHRAGKKRERANEAHMAKLRKAHKDFAKGQETISDESIERLMATAGEMRASMLGFLQRRTSEERAAVSQQAAQDAIAASAEAGNEFAQSLTGNTFSFGAGPEYEAAGQRVTDREQDTIDVEQAALGQRAAGRARSQYDIENAQQLRLEQAPIQQAATMDAMMVGAERAGLRSQYQQRLAELGTERPMDAGNDLMLAGALANVAGQGILSASAFRDA